MSVSASEIFELLEMQKLFTVERDEIASAEFGRLRRSVHQMWLRLRDADNLEALDVSTRLRASLSEWLTVPIPFESAMYDALADRLGRPDAVHSRWGSDVGRLYEEALHAAVEIQTIKNPLRVMLLLVIRKCRSEGRAFRVYCHPRAQGHFESILDSAEDPPLSEDTFIRSVREYRNVAPFDVLIKVGPLRARGWGSAPDALLSAPRFRMLRQVVWSGCSDDPDFGYDPAKFPDDDPSSQKDTLVAASQAVHGRAEWTTRVTFSGDDPGAADGYAREADELHVFREVNQDGENRPATLVQVDGKHGILYPPSSHVLSYDPNAPILNDSIDNRIPDDTLHVGMFVIRPFVDDIDVGGVRAEHGYYSQAWKARLGQEILRDAAGLVTRLRDAGLSLVHLRAAISHWCEPPTTVIHAPQQMKHFEILIRALGLGIEAGVQRRQASRPWWRLAWAEISRSRGEAIQAGVLEQELVEEQVRGILRNMLPQIQERAALNVGFRLDLPAVSGVIGTLLFFRVSAIDRGFHAPEAELKVVHELETIDQWRD